MKTNENQGLDDLEALEKAEEVQNEIQSDATAGVNSLGDDEGQVTLVSVFGRGHWLAARLAQMRIPVKVIDLSHLLGVWPAEDVAGPFGFFTSESISDLQRESVFAEDSYELVPNGFTILLQEGPLEFQGPLTSFRLEKLGIPDSVQNLLQMVGGKVDAKLKSQLKESQQLSFSQCWPWQLAHHLSSSIYCESVLASKKLREPLPLRSNFYRRNPSRGSLDRSLEWLKSKGVQIISGKKIVDLSRKTVSEINGLEIEGEGVHFCNQLVWCLSGEETYYLNEKLGQVLFPNGFFESGWSWVRYRILMSACIEREMLPGQVCYIHEIENSWTHENLMMILRTGSPDQFDIWVRTPTVQRFNKDYLARQGDKVLRRLAHKMGEVECKILSFPQEYYYTYSQIGAPRFPIYSNPTKSNHFICAKYNNLNWHSPEVWGNLSLTGQFMSQRRVQRTLLKWWLDTVEKKRKLLEKSKKKNGKESEK